MVTNAAEVGPIVEIPPTLFSRTLYLHSAVATVERLELPDLIEHPQHAPAAASRLAARNGKISLYAAVGFFHQRRHFFAGVFYHYLPRNSTGVYQAGFCTPRFASKSSIC